MHQPLYVDPQTGQATLPWVRLHGARGYLDVAKLLWQHPSIALNINFVPSLVDQLEAVAAGASDRYLDLVRRDSWLPEEREFLLASLFSVNWTRGVDPRPRYRELLEKRGRSPRPGELSQRAHEFSDEELRDLTVLFHLSWLGFAARRGAHSEAITELEHRGRGYTFTDLEAVLTCGRDGCAEVLPLYRALAARGQIELSASPYYHPIVPLLIDSDCAGRAQSGVALPTRFAWPADAQAQIRRGREAHERNFGASPRGMWPPEGSISPEAVAAYRAEGIGWLASDEGNLWRSLKQVRSLDDLYRPWHFQGVDLVFRDRELSDRIGFRYAFSEPETAVADLLSHLRQAPQNGGSPPLVTLALDGENPWEAYPCFGEPFLQTLFRALEEAKDVRATTLAAHLSQHPGGAPLAQLHSGSWIDSDFHIWIGDPIKNRAWQLLGQARRRFAERFPNPEAPEAEAAYWHLLAAEGSDWLWWFGEPFHTAEAATFDRLFRAHLVAVYRELGGEVPPELGELIDPEVRDLAVIAPRGPISPHIDGKVTSYYEWIDAGLYRVPHGAAMAESPLVNAIYFGCDLEQLYLRFDPRDGVPRDFTIVLRDQNRERVVARDDLRQCVVGEIVELALPWAELGFSPGSGVELFVRFSQHGVVLARYPAEHGLTLIRPGEDFSAKHWQV